MQKAIDAEDICTDDEKEANGMLNHDTPAEKRNNKNPFSFNIQFSIYTTIYRILRFYKDEKELVRQV
jgi:hypothetical protein